MEDTPFARNSRIVASTLAICERMYFGSLGSDDLPADQARISKDPLDLLDDFANVIQAAKDRIVELMEKDLIS